MTRRGAVEFALLVGCVTMITVSAVRGDCWWLGMAGAAAGAAGLVTSLQAWGILGRFMVWVALWPIRVTEWALGPCSWPHQFAQFVVTMLGAGAAWWWYGWPAAAIVATTATAVSFVALLEGRKLQRERVIALPGVHVNG